MTAFSLNIHNGRNGTVVAACDKELVGETFDDGHTTLTVDSAFYGGDTADIEDVMAAVDGCMTTNFVGDQLITALKENDIVSDDEVRYVDGVPHIQLFFI